MKMYLYAATIAAILAGPIEVLAQGDNSSRTQPAEKEMCPGLGGDISILEEADQFRIDAFLNGVVAYSGDVGASFRCTASGAAHVHARASALSSVTVSKDALPRGVMCVVHCPAIALCDELMKSSQEAADVQKAESSMVEIQAKLDESRLEKGRASNSLFEARTVDSVSATTESELRSQLDAIQSKLDTLAQKRKQLADTLRRATQSAENADLKIAEFTKQLKDIHTKLDAGRSSLARSAERADIEVRKARSILTRRAALTSSGTVAIESTVRSKVRKAISSAATLSSSRIDIVTLAADWCTNCKELVPEIAAIATQYERVNYCVIVRGYVFRTGHLAEWRKRMAENGGSAYAKIECSLPDEQVHVYPLLTNITDIPQTFVLHGSGVEAIVGKNVDKIRDVVARADLLTTCAGAATIDK